MNNYLEIDKETLVEEILLTIQNATMIDIIKVSNQLGLYNIIDFSEEKNTISIVGK